MDLAEALTNANRAIERQAQEIERLRAALVEAKEAVQSWGAYADEYFQKKWDLAGDIKAIDDALAGSIPIETARDLSLTA